MFTKHKMRLLLKISGKKMLIALREAKETHYWFDVIEVSGLLSIKELSKLKDEASEIVAIMVSIINKLKK